MARIKICGITNKEDAHIASSLGADYLGFIFHKKSPRYITPKKAAEIIRTLPESIKKVGVFVDANPEHEISMAQSLGLDLIQLHGRESTLHMTHLKSNGIKTIRSIRVKEKIEIHEPLRSSDYILLDTYKKGIIGGTGETFDWSLAGSIEKDIIRRKTFLSGGLTASNIKEAINTLAPFAVDVCSGVESSPGKKDKEKLSLFIKNAK